MKTISENTKSHHSPRQQGFRYHKRILFVVLILFLVPCIAWAKMYPCPFEAPRTREIWSQAPQTPEALLRVIKSFQDNPNMDGFAFIEQAFGLAREKWQDNIRTKGGGRRWVDYWNPFLTLAPPVPYAMYNRWFILHENGNLMDVGIINFAKGFCVTR